MGGSLCEGEIEDIGTEHLGHCLRRRDTAWDVERVRQYRSEDRERNQDKSREMERNIERNYEKLEKWWKIEV